MIPRILVLCSIVAAGIAAQQAAPDKEALQQRLAAVKQSMAQNQAQLKQYAWTETTEVIRKGEVAKRDQSACKYGPDGKVVKTPIGESPEPAKKKRGLKGKIVANKVADIKDYLTRAGSLIKRYIPPDPQLMQASMAAGKASLDKTTGTMVFNDYVKAGDKVTLSFDLATKKLRSFAVATYLDTAKDGISLTATFSSLPDGTNFLEESVLDAKAKEIQIKTTNFGHSKAGA